MGHARIATLEELRRHLQGAIALEHATMPPYLCALYSIKPGTNLDAVEILTSVFVEEMLHMTLAANLLNAVGGTPRIAHHGFVPNYPTSLPYSDASFLIPLARFSRESVATFMRIERPEATDAPAQADGFETIGQFYQAIGLALRERCEEMGESNVFSGDPRRQVTPECFAYGAPETVVPVYDLASALRAVNEIEQQGEGLQHAEVWDGDHDMFHPERDEVAHYFRFEQLLRGRRYQRGDTPLSGPTGAIIDIDWDTVHPMADNPRLSDHAPECDVRQRAQDFQRNYSRTLRLLDETFNGAPHRIDDAISLMMGVRDVVRVLMTTRCANGSINPGPVFEYLDDESSSAVLERQG